MPAPRLEIGGGTNRLWPDARQLDPIHGDPDLRARVQDGIPMPDGTFSAAIASHVLEHIPSGQERIDALNNVWRALVPGGTFEIIVPLFGFTDAEGGHVVNGWWAIADPTHCSLWWAPESFLYFCGGAFAAHADYGILYWAPLEPTDWEVRSGWEGHIKLRKPT